MAKITGRKEWKRRLEGMKSAQVAKTIVAGLYAAGQLIEIEAELSITRGSISGKNHVASKPGAPPLADSRQLDTNIETEIVSVNPPQVTVTSNAEYSVPLEFGTSRMAERPFMRPAVAVKRKDAIEVVRKSMRKAMRQAKAR